MTGLHPTDILQDLRAKLHDIKPDLPKDFPPDDHFREVWRLDSLDLVEFVARIEQQYRVVIPDEDLELFTSLNRVIQYLQEKMQG
ncbi:MAG: acyl carrier protein [Bacteroidetes bacterium]|nr:acyl carrier protein [Bacteroidota bacterium]